MSSSIISQGGQGLRLSAEIAVPIPAIKPQLLQSDDYFWKVRQLKHGTSLIIEPIFNFGVLIANGNALAYSFLRLDENNDCQMYLDPSLHYFDSSIIAVHRQNKIPDVNQTQVFIIVEAEKDLVLFNINIHTNTFEGREKMKNERIRCLQFINETEFVLITHKFVLKKFSLMDGSFSLEYSADAMPFLNGGQTIKQCLVERNVAFYLIQRSCNKDKMESEEGKSRFSLRLNEYTLTSGNKVRSIKKDIEIKTDEEEEEWFEKLEVITLEDIYCIKTKSRIILVKKVDGEYAVIDRIIEQNRIQIQRTILNQSFNFACLGGSAVELKTAHFSNSAFQTQVLGRVKLSPSEQKEFQLIWPTETERRVEIILIFKRDKRLVFCNTIENRRAQRILSFAEQGAGQASEMVQELAATEEISKRNIAFVLWEKSSRQIQDFSAYFLPYSQYGAARKQLSSVLERQRVEKSVLVQVLEKMSLLLKDRLKTRLSVFMLEDYLECDFLLRKIRALPNCSYSGQNLQQIEELGIADIYAQIIKAKLFPDSWKAEGSKLSFLQSSQLEPKSFYDAFKRLLFMQYQIFMKDLLSHFSSCQIFHIMVSYPFLILADQQENILHRADKAENLEEDIDCLIHNSDNQQQITKSSLLRSIFQQYSSDYIDKVFSNFSESNRGFKNFLRKNGFVNDSKDDSEQKQDLTQSAFFLVWDILNSTRLEGQRDLAKEFLQNFLRDSSPEEESHKTIWLYTSIHYFMLKHSLYEDLGKFSIRDIRTLSQIDISQIVIYLAQHKKGQQLIFSEFKTLFDSNNTITYFVTSFIIAANSKQCKIEDLLILLKQLSKTTHEFQENIKNLAKILFSAFCFKAKLHMARQITQLQQIMTKIILFSDPLKRKYKILQHIQEIVLIMDASSSFEKEKTLEDLIQLTQQDQIYEQLLNFFCEQKIKKQTAFIGEQQICLKSPKGIIQIIKYLRNNLDSTVSMENLITNFGQKLAQLHRFDDLRQIVKYQSLFENLSFNSADFSEKLAMTLITKGLAQEQITSNSIFSDILQLLPSDNDLKLHLQMILKFKAFIENSGHRISYRELERICQNWIKSRQNCINQIFKLFLASLSLDFINTTIDYLDKTNECESRSREQIFCERKDEYCKYLMKGAEILVDRDRVNQVIPIFAFFRSKQYKIPYYLLSEVFLKVVCQRHQKPEQLPIARQLIEYFSQNMENDSLIQQLFETNLASGKFDSTHARQRGLTVDPILCYTDEPVRINLQWLWNFAASKCEKNNFLSWSKKPYEQILYAYFFEMELFRRPYILYQNIFQISFSLQMNAKILLFFAQKQFKYKRYLQDVEISVLINEFYDSFTGKKSEIKKKISTTYDYDPKLLSLRTGVLQALQVIEASDSWKPDSFQQKLQKRFQSIQYARYMQRQDYVEQESTQDLLMKELNMEELVQKLLKIQRKEQERIQTHNSIVGLINLGQYSKILVTYDKQKIVEVVKQLYLFRQKTYKETLIILQNLQLISNDKQDIYQKCSQQSIKDLPRVASNLQRLFPVSFYLQPFQNIKQHDQAYNQMFNKFKKQVSQSFMFYFGESMNEIVRFMFDIYFSKNYFNKMRNNTIDQTERDEKYRWRLRFFFPLFRRQIARMKQEELLGIIRQNSMSDEEKMQIVSAEYENEI